MCACDGLSHTHVHVRNPKTNCVSYFVIDWLLLNKSFESRNNVKAVVDCSVSVVEQFVCLLFVFDCRRCRTGLLQIEMDRDDLETDVLAWLLSLLSD
jgi:hypothetical protein